ncbi:MAG: energy transducer TonB [Thiohalocapsa sp.]
MTIPSDDPQAPFTLDLTPIWPEEDGRLAPVFLADPLWVEFEQPEPPLPMFEVAAAPWLAGMARFALSEPDAAAAAPEEPPPEPAPGTSPSGVAASLGMHLVVLLLGLLALAVGNGAPADTGGAFPVQLVFAAPAALPPEQPAGDAIAEDAAPAPPGEAGPPPPPSPPPAPAPAAAVAPPPEAAAARKETRAAVPPAKPSPPAATATRAVGHSTAAAAKAAAAAATANTGAGAGGGDYLASLEQLTRPYLYMLSPAFLAGRRGRTTLSIAVLDDGTISRIDIKRSSGYPDIDTRIEAMVQAVGRFPPLPQQLRRPGTDLDFNLIFPDVLQQ